MGRAGGQGGRGRRAGWAGQEGWVLSIVPMLTSKQCEKQHIMIDVALKVVQLL